MISQRLTVTVTFRWEFFFIFQDHTNYISNLSFHLRMLWRSLSNAKDLGCINANFQWSDHFALEFVVLFLRTSNVNEKKRVAAFTTVYLSSSFPRQPLGFFNDE